MHDLTVAAKSLVEDSNQLNLRLHARRTPVSKVTVQLYLDTASQGRRLIGLQRIPYVPEDGDYIVRNFFDPEVCGPATIVATAKSDNGGSASRTVRTEIRCAKQASR
jgi:hypothetical protein